MDVHRVIAELRTYLELLDDAILSLERLASENHRSTRQRPAVRSAPTEGGMAKEMPAGHHRVMGAGAESL